VTPVAPPALLPLDAQDVADQALAILRLDPADVDAARIEQAALVAIDLATQQLDFADVPVALSVAVTDAVVTLTVELYRRKDAPFGVTDSWSVDGAVLRLSSDVFRGVRSQLAKYRDRWGVA
jgi:hypothetical protein